MVQPQIQYRPKKKATISIIAWEDGAGNRKAIPKEFTRQKNTWIHPGFGCRGQFSFGTHFFISQDYSCPYDTHLVEGFSQRRKGRNEKVTRVLLVLLCDLCAFARTNYFPC
jgi:hypothetical protein